MARKFNMGRQGEISLSKEMHDLLLALKYVNNGVDEPIQDLQTPIPIGSLWNDQNRGQNIIKVNTANKGWKPAFEGFYHPVDLFTKPLNPVHGQLWIDGSKDNTLHFYDENTSAWIAVRAASTTSNQILVDMHNNFLHMYPLKDADIDSGTKTFIVPHEPYGKLTNDGLFIHPSSAEYEATSDITVRTTINSDKMSWIHANPHKMFTMEKKLIQLDSTFKVYGLFDNNTEFFYLDETKGWKHMMPFDALNPETCDFKPFDKGIEIISDRVKASKYIMMYAYSFYDTARPGKLIRKDFEVGNNSEIHVGLSTKHPMIFVDGLYLEQSKYDYNNETGNVTIHDKIINPMDIMAIVFQHNEPVDFEINQTIGETKDALVGTLVKNYVKPMVFVSGVMGAELFGPDQIIYNRETKQITIKNWGPHQPKDISYAMVVEGESTYVTHGKFDNTKTILSDKIKGNNEEYMLWTDGVLVSSRHLDVSQGEVRLNNAIPGMEYLLLKIADAEETALLFDGRAMNYTVAIKNEDGSLYNECSNACVFVDGKALMMRDTVEKTNVPVKGAHGQIVKVKNTEDGDIYNYYIYDDSVAQWHELPKEKIKEVEDLIKADYSAGSIMVNAPEGSAKGTYYAYTYANAVEEPLLRGFRALIKDKEQYAVNVEHKFNNGQGALTVYTNKLLNPDVHEEPSNTGKFIVPPMESTNEMFSPYDDGELMYIVERPEKHESASCIREVLTAANRDMQYDNGYTTTISLMPGVVSVYLNGVRLERREFTVIDDHTLMLHVPAVGGQRNYNPDDQSTWNKFLYYDSKGEHELTSLRDDNIVIEVRQDFNVKTQTVPVRFPGQRIYYLEDDGLPKSLLLSQDLIRIYINGVIYDGEYNINRDNGSITLLDSELENMLNIDPIARFFETHPVEYDEYLQEYGKPYVAKPQTNRITFEWR